MSRKLVYDYSSMTTHKGIPMVTARYFWTNQKEYTNKGVKEKAKHVARMSLANNREA